MADHSLLEPALHRPIGMAVLRAGFVPLTDAAPLIVADELGLFGRRGLSVSLTAAASWAALRDRIAFGALDMAPLLSPMPIAAALGLGGVGCDLIATATLGRNGNTVTLGNRLLAEMAATGVSDPGAALAAVLAERRRRGGAPPALAVVFAYSSHNYLLRAWLANSGIDPDLDVRLVVVPPPRIALALARGEIEGFCAGEPWGSRARELGVGGILMSTGAIWRDHPEKVLAFPAGIDPAIATRATAAVIEAARWLDMPDNAADAAAILRRRVFPDLSEPVVSAALQARAGLPSLRFYRDDATEPDPAHGAWWLSQMRRWGHAPDDADPVAAIWRPDLWRDANRITRKDSP